jgi:peroxiredoxin family protein
VNDAKREEPPNMSEKQKMVVVVTQGFQDERASVAWSVANGGVGTGFEVTMFLVSSGVDWVRKSAATRRTISSGTSHGALPELLHPGGAGGPAQPKVEGAGRRSRARSVGESCIRTDGPILDGD